MTRVVYWGTYDLGKPRNRIIIDGLRANGVEVTECHREIWPDIEDKSQISGTLKKIRILWQWLISYPILLFKFAKLPKHDFIVIGYLGHIDIFFLWPIAKTKGMPIVWDAFLSIYNTVVEDRKLISHYNPLAIILWVCEWLACRLASRLILDTKAHGVYFIKKFSLDAHKVDYVLVGAEKIFFSPKKPTLPAKQKETPFIILFYGQYIPLHGIEHIVKAAQLTSKEAFRWVLIGQGQERKKIDHLISTLELKNVTCIDWVPYTELINWLKKADVCLGIFGATEKAGMVIPNKVFQIIAAGRPFITAASPAILDFIPPNEPGATLIPIASPEALAKAVVNCYQRRQWFSEQFFFVDLKKKITPQAIGLQFLRILLSIRSSDSDRTSSK